MNLAATVEKNTAWWAALTPVDLPKARKRHGRLLQLEDFAFRFGGTTVTYEELLAVEDEIALGEQRAADLLDEPMAYTGTNDLQLELATLRGEGLAP